MERPLSLSSTMLRVGDALVFLGGAVTAGVPLGLAAAGLGYTREGLMLALPLVACVVLASVFIKKQKQGMKRGGTMTWAVARLTLWPTVAFNLLRHLVGERKYYDEVYPGVFVGGAPWALLGEQLVAKHGIKTVVNCCEEYAGPEAVYQLRGVQQLRLHCIDFCDVPLEKIVHAVEFIHARSVEKGGPVYIHCKSGKGRAVTIATAYLAKYWFDGSTENANRQVKDTRPTAIGTVYLRPAMVDFAQQYCVQK